MEHITIGMLAHVDSGKTTLSESILYLSGAIRKAGRVDRGDSFLDVDEQERGRGITIFSKQAHFTAGDRDFYLLDTPGHIDFSAEMERTLRVLDYAVLIISGADGIRSHTKTLWELLEDYGIPVFLFVNKMDQPGTDRQLRLREIADTFGSECIDFGIEEADRDEQIAMTDEEALEYYMEHEGIPADMTADLIARRKVFPVFFGSALKMDGVRELIAALAKYTRQPSYQKEFGARVYKIARDRQGNRLTFMKVTGGAIRSGDMVNGEKVRQVFIFNGEKSEIAKQAQAGMICVSVTLKPMRQITIRSIIILPFSIFHTSEISLKRRAGRICTGVLIYLQGHIRRDILSIFIRFRSGHRFLRNLRRVLRHGSRRLVCHGVPVGSTDIR